MILACRGPTDADVIVKLKRSSDDKIFDPARRDSLRTDTRGSGYTSECECYYRMFDGQTHGVGYIIVFETQTHGVGYIIILSVTDERSLMVMPRGRF